MVNIQKTHVHNNIERMSNTSSHTLLCISIKEMKQRASVFHRPLNLMMALDLDL